MLKKLIPLIFVFVLAISTHAFAKDLRIGTIVEIEGTASVKQAEQSMKLKVNDPVYLNDVLTTDKNSKLVTLLLDDTEFILAEETSFTVDEYVYDPKAEKGGRADYNVLKGAFLYVSGLLSKENEGNITIKNNYGTIGIRGTTVWGGDVEGKGYGVLVADGAAQFITPKGSIRLGAGQGTFITEESPYPSRAKTWGEPVMKAALATITLKDQDALKTKLEAVKALNNTLRTGEKKAEQLQQQLNNEELIDIEESATEEMSEEAQEIGDIFDDAEEELSRDDEMELEEINEEISDDTEAEEEENAVKAEETEATSEEAEENEGNQMTPEEIERERRRMQEVLRKNRAERAKK